MADFAGESTMRGRTSASTAGGIASSPGGATTGERPSQPQPSLPQQQPQQQQLLTPHADYSRTFMIGCVILLIIVLWVTASSSGAGEPTTLQKTPAVAANAGAEEGGADEQHQNNNNNNKPAVAHGAAGQFPVVPHLSHQRAQKLFGGARRAARRPTRRPKFLSKNQQQQQQQSAAGGGGDDVTETAAGGSGGSYSNHHHEGDGSHHRHAADASSHHHDADAAHSNKEEDNKGKQPQHVDDVTEKQQQQDVAEKQTVADDTTAAPTAAAAETEEAPRTSSAAAADAKNGAPLESCVDYRFGCGFRQNVVLEPVRRSDRHNGPPVCSFHTAVNRTIITEPHYGMDSIGGTRCYVPRPLPLVKENLISIKKKKAAAAAAAVPLDYTPSDAVSSCFDINRELFPLFGAAQVISIGSPGGGHTGSGVDGGHKLACYNGQHDMVCKFFAASFRWEPPLMDMLSYAGVMLRKFRQTQFVNFVRRVRAKYAAATATAGKQEGEAATFSAGKKRDLFEAPFIAGTPQYYVDQTRPVLSGDYDPNSLTDDNYGVEFVDIGMHVGTMTSVMWRLGFPVKGFEPMPTNINLLLATRCLNELNTQFPSVEQCRASFYGQGEIAEDKAQHDKREARLAECLSKPALDNVKDSSMASGQQQQHTSVLSSSQCPVAESVPFQLSHVAIGAKSGERCTMFSDAGNIGDVFVSCDKNLTETAEKHSPVFIRDSWYTVRGAVTTRRIDEYVFRDHESICTTADDAGGVRFQHQAFRRQKELRNLATRVVSAAEHNANTKKKQQQQQHLNTLFTATEAVGLARLQDETWRMRRISNASLTTAENLILLGDAHKALQQQQQQQLPTRANKKGEDQGAAAASSNNNNNADNKNETAEAAGAVPVEVAHDLFLNGLKLVEEDDGGAAAAAAHSSGKNEEHTQQQQHQRSDPKAAINSLLEELQPGHGFGFKDYIVKIDVEGHEANVIKGAHKWLSHPTLKPKMLLVEVWTHMNVTGFSRTMMSYGYVALSTRTMHWIAKSEDVDTHLAALKKRGEPHDDVAWMPLEWTPVLIIEEHVRRLEKHLGKELKPPSAS